MLRRNVCSRTLILSCHFQSTTRADFSQASIDLRPTPPQASRLVPVSSTALAPNQWRLDILCSRANLRRPIRRRNARLANFAPSVRETPLSSRPPCEQVYSGCGPGGVARRKLNKKPAALMETHSESCPGAMNISLAPLTRPAPTSASASASSQPPQPSFAQNFRAPARSA